MRRGFGLIGLVGTILLLAIVGVIAYNVGWSDGVGTHLPAGSAAAGGAVGPYYGWRPIGFGFGFGLFGIFWFFLIVFGIFWLFRLLFWGAFGRRMWGGGWGYGHGMYGGSGHHGMPPGIEERMQDWHRRAHGEQPPAPPAPPAPGSGTTPPPPPPESRSV